jgi:hypothetical protein
LASRLFDYNTHAQLTQGAKAAVSADQGPGCIWKRLTGLPCVLRTAVFALGRPGGSCGWAKDVDAGHGRGLSGTAAAGQAYCLTQLNPIKTPKPETRARGLSPMTSTFRTSGPDVFDLRLNSHSRLNLIQAINLGADEALMLDPRGFVASFDSTNFFIVRGDDELWTSTGLYSFKGITQDNVIHAWRAAGRVVRECDFTLGVVTAQANALYLDNVSQG